MNGLTDFVMDLSPAARLGLLAMVVVQLALQVYALVDLFRRPRVAGGRKWVWVLVIVVGNAVGALVYLALGRAAPPSADAVAGDAAARQRAIDRLYGDRGKS